MTHVETPQLDPNLCGPAAADPSDDTVSPQARLVASRAAIQLWLDRTYHPERLAPVHLASSAAVQAKRESQNAPAWLGLIVDSLSDVPAARVGIRYVRRWWARHPWRATTEFAASAGKELLEPTAQRYPMLLLGAGLISGAALYKLRPWRWVSGGAVLASLLPPLSLATITAATRSFVSRFTAPEQPPADAVAGADEAASVKPPPHANDIP